MKRNASDILGLALLNASLVPYYYYSCCVMSCTLALQFHHQSVNRSVSPDERLIGLSEHRFH